MLLQELGAASYYNAVEATRLADLLEAFLLSPGAALRPDDVGVMATFRRQVQKIRGVLRSRGLGSVRVGTVDDYQGQEERIIFISTVLSRPSTLAGSAASTGLSNLEFFTNPKRFNVAMSRAKVLNVVLGHPLVLMESGPWSELLRRCVAQGACFGAGSPEAVEGGAWSSAEFGEDDDEQRRLEQAMLNLSQSSVLGMGYMQESFPELRGFIDEQEWKVAV
ncbi:hypothetical protein CYMTET_40545 [Cymbomonas tetramitiformis]|uniref:DNA2/NAM7 helicase-like C-terminal domain-containing protein n=1 Tax=Cymbomonas tetramitiformis TaxID=36881 RepID=A0AAE0F4I0_9CHLO|nr:hypothetical protein CYMTET_40545 [Cymbomonas tetramitiformis]